jgi:hypothetical protein
VTFTNTGAGEGSLSNDQARVPLSNDALDVRTVAERREVGQERVER